MPLVVTRETPREEMKIGSGENSNRSFSSRSKLVSIIQNPLLNNYLTILRKRICWKTSCGLKQNLPFDILTIQSTKTLTERAYCE